MVLISNSIAINPYHYNVLEGWNYSDLIMINTFPMRNWSFEISITSKLSIRRIGTDSVITVNFPILDDNVPE